MALTRLWKYCGPIVREPFRGVILGIPRPGWIESCAGAKRHLLSEDVVRLEEFQQRKLSVASIVSGSNEKYIELFGEKLRRNELILRDELKLLLHLCQSADDMVIARDAIYRYHAENKNFAFAEFKFGPLFMRLCYEIGMEGMAAAAITDPNMKGFFNDSTSFNLAMDMLFIKGSYEYVLEVLKTKKSQGIQFNKDTLILATATCYKMNTTESYALCIDLIEKAQIKGDFIPRPSFCFAVALALRQGDVKKAQSLYFQIMNTQCRVCQNLKIAIMAMSGAVTGAIHVLSAAVVPENSLFVKKLEYSQEVVDLLRLQSEGSAHTMQLENVVTLLEQAGQVTQQTLEDMLCQTPTGKKKLAPVMVERRISQRTLKPLHQTLLSE